MSRSSTDLIVVHCSATPPSRDVTAKEIDRWHRQKGWLKIGYHFVIKRDGTVETGRALMEPGAHVRGYNARSIGICLIGGVSETEMQGKWAAPESNFTLPQWSSLNLLVAEMQEKFPDARVAGHNEYDNKACPSFDVQSWLATREG